MADVDSSRYPILYVDDEPAALATFENSFGREFRVATAQNGPDALRQIREKPIAVLVADQRMPEMHGVEVIERARGIRPHIVPIILTGYTDSESLKQAINRAGVFQYVDKPWRRDELGDVLRRAVHHHHLTVENERLTRELAEANELLQRKNEALTDENVLLRREVGHELVGDSAAVRHLRTQIARVAPHSATVLLLGETGTGKEVVARAIHAASARRGQPFITLNCSAIPKDLFESELFGHEKGSFTGATATKPGCFAMADTGTLFLDEIGDLPIDLQPKLLRVLQEGEVQAVGSSRIRKVDVRVLAATNKDLVQAARVGAFRDDLYSRLNVFPIRISPLRDRRDDVPLLARHFLDLESRRMFGRAAPPVEEGALRVLAGLDYPGNVRDLRNLIVRVLINSGGEDELREEAFLEAGDQPPPAHREPGDGSYRELRDAAERQIIERALGESGGNKRRAAERLRITEQGFYKALKRLGLSGGDDEAA